MELARPEISGAVMFDNNSFDDRSFDIRSWLMDAVTVVQDYIVTIARRFGRR